MKVVCINNNRYIDILTFGKIYKVLCSNVNPSYILVKNDDDKLCTIPRKLFMSMKEHRKERISKLLEKI